MIQHEFHLLKRFEAETIDGVSALPGAHELLNDTNHLQSDLFAAPVGGDVYPGESLRGRLIAQNSLSPLAESFYNIP
ncbi:MAG: hypothetical protein GPOALKHO_000280 [Sodalis sp.]|uniref:hypothetical protein n=1 Tax=Sodalis sp. (in: enterobacteria) TaxID=1898979 RepID=UPI003872BA64|nr:MAG: hypothetical protein GPOALKHO_000280 [Sodalis sp.]